MGEIVHIIEPGSDDDRIRRAERHDGGPVLGAWYWVTGNKDHNDEPKPDWLGCAMKLGSNYVEVQSPPEHHGGHYDIRIHFDNFWTRLRYEPNPEAVIGQRIAHWQGESRRLLGEIEAVTRSLGMTPQEKIGGPAAAAGDGAGALMVLSSQADPKAYSRALTVAKETTLPALFKEVKEANGALAKWMKAPVMPMLAQMRDQKELVADIDDRIFSVSLYAGLTEETIKVADGEPAGMLDKLHVMQRMAYMDEECLANYRVGGMEFNDLAAFDAWLAEPENRDRILPFPRTLVAFRVRRNRKGRDWEGSVRTLMLNLEKEEADKLTFLYIRNGDQLWRLSTDIDFGPMIFPDATAFNPNEPKMVKMFARRVDKFISVREFESRAAAERQRERDYKAWEESHPGERNPHWCSDHDFRGHSMRDWVPFDPTSVYYDDAAAELAREIKEYNRVALIIQGLFDRSMVLHPHPPVRTWSADGFDAAVKLVYDGTGVLHHGEPPDFEAYRALCNASLGVGSLTVGQDDFWQRREGARESARRDRDYRDKSDYRPERYKPHGNPGPGYMARIERWSKSKGGTFTWKRDKRSGANYWNETVADTITVPAAELFNVDAYEPGDFRQFFADPRTRAEYLKWAPMLIAAEEHHANKAKEK